MIRLYPLRTQTEFDQLKEAAKEDAHNVMQPTHYAEKDGEIVGCVSIGPTVWWWLHSRKCHKRESYEMFIAVETLLRDRGVQHYVILLPESSPYNRNAERMGFRHVEATHVWTKEA